MPINIGEVEMLIGNIEGVQSVVKTEFKNLCGGTSGYSPNSYDIIRQRRINKFIHR